MTATKAKRGRGRPPLSTSGSGIRRQVFLPPEIEAKLRATNEQKSLSLGIIIATEKLP